MYCEFAIYFFWIAIGIHVVIHSPAAQFYLTLSDHVKQGHSHFNPLHLGKEHRVEGYDAIEH